MSGLGNAELAVLIALALVIVLLIAVFGRRGQPTAAQTPAPMTAAASAEVEAVKADVHKLEGRMGEFEHHLAQMRTMMGALPSKDAVNRLEVKITEVAGRVDTTHEITVRNGRVLERIENRLINGANL